MFRVLMYNGVSMLRGYVRMQIRSAVSAGELSLFIGTHDPEAAETVGRLHKSGLLDLSLCFIAEEGSRPVGALVTVPVSSDGVKTAFAAALAYNEEHTLSQLYLRAFEVLRGRGIGYVFSKHTEKEKPMYYERFGWNWIVTLGFVPPTLDEDALNFAGKRLTEDAEPSCRPLEFPEELGIPMPECLFYGENRVNEEQLAEEVYTTRERRRLAERAALIVFIIAVIVIGCVKSSLRAFIGVVPMLGIGMVLLYRNIFQPKKVVREVVEGHRRKGMKETDDRLFFGEERFIHFSEGRGGAITSYDNIRIVYVKPEFLFLCKRSDNKSAGGWFVRNSSLTDKQALLDHIRSKSPEVVFKK